MEGITNEMLYELIREFKADVNRRFEEVDKRFDLIDKRFEQVDKRFEQVDKRFEQVDKRFEQVDRQLLQLGDAIKELRSLQLKDQEKLQQVHESRDRVEIRFTRAWGLTSVLMGMMGGGIAYVALSLL